ncbi:putative uncharacterized protein [Clostridium sp. CAG:609]|nr:putative uncharacterized protein [Clostridium sp. CAG:609]
MKTLVIMAAGMGSRFGGLKQIEPVGPSGEIIADYSVYDAKKAGFERVVFIIRKENEDYFKEHIINKFNDKIEVELAFQELSYIPEDVILPEGRVKMLGTGHALYCAQDYIDDDFIIINSDDFYGYDSFLQASKFLDSKNEDYMSVNYPFYVTMSKYGKVKRGVVKEDNGYVKEIIESEISVDGDKIIASSLVNGDIFEIEKDTPVAVNFFAFRKSFLNVLNQEFDKFIHGDIDLKSEFLLPDILKCGLAEKKFKVRCATSKSKWIGMTYKEDEEDVKKSINELISLGEYPNNLWG